MGREIRMVPPNWEHPKKSTLRFENGAYQYVDSDQSMYDTRYEDACKDWTDEYNKWTSGDFPDYADEDDRKMPYWDWAGMPPDKEYYRPWKDEEATWYQLWQTVSEGTPVSPPFATKEELANYLAVNGDYWDQKRGTGGWGIEAANRFVNVGRAPSFIAHDGKFEEGKLVE